MRHFQIYTKEYRYITNSLSKAFVNIVLEMKIELEAKSLINLYLNPFYLKLHYFIGFVSFYSWVARRKIYAWKLERRDRLTLRYD